MYHDSMIELFKKMTNIKYKPLSQDKNPRLLLTDIDGLWYMKIISKKPE